MKLKTKLTMSFFVGVLLLAGLGIVNVFYLTDIRLAVQSVAESNIGEVKNSAHLSLLLSKINGDMNSYLLSNHFKEKNDTNLRANILTDIGELKETTKRLIESTEIGILLADDDDEVSDEAGEIEEIEELVELVHSYEELISETLNLHDTSGVEDATNFYLDGEASLQHEVLNGSNDLYEDAIEEIEEESGQVILAVSRTKRLTIGLTAVAFVTALIIGLLISKNITRRIVGLEKATRELKKGNFNIEVEVGSEKDEINSLETSFQMMVDQLRTSTISIEELEKRVVARTTELENAKFEADNANRAKSDFLANMSHELRTPLNHIIGFTELITDEKFGPLNDIQKEYLGDSLGSSKHLLTLINDILDLSKVEAGKLELHLSDFDIHELLQKSLVMFKEKAMKHSLTIEVIIDEDVPKMISADQVKMKQIFYNLVSNAVKFTPDLGEIMVKASVGEMVVGQGRNMLEFAVSDSGIGIDNSDIANIFNPFEQSGDVIERQQGGTGLGLTLTKKFIELHDGEIEVQSEGLSKGATFTFTIPQNDRRKA